MKAIFITIAAMLSISFCYSQSSVIKLQAGKTYKQKILKGEKKRYKINLDKDDFCSIVVMQKSVDVIIDVLDPSQNKLYVYDTPNGDSGPESIDFKAGIKGTYYFDIYPFNDYSGMTESRKKLFIEQNQGDYEISDISILAAKDNKMLSLTDKLNLGFEKITGKNIPANWVCWYKGTNVKSDTIVKKSGKASLAFQKEFPNSAAYAYDSIPIVFKGNNIEIRGYFKTQDVSEGDARMQIYFADSNGPVNTPAYSKDILLPENQDWKQYSISFPLLEDFKTVYLIPRLSGKGRMWADDIQILIDGKDIYGTKYVEPKKFKADTDNEFDSESKISEINLTDFTTDNLYILGKVWGFLKYYHPAIAKGDYNWDYELFRIIPKLLSSENANDRNGILSEWISSLGKINSTKKVSEMNTIAVQLPDLSWIDSSAFGEKLTSQLNEIKNAGREKENYYVGLYPAGNPQFKNGSKYRSMKWSDAGFRLLSLFCYWNIIEYYFPDKFLIGENWNDVLKEYIPKVLNDTTELEYDLTMLSLICRIHDSHASMFDQRNVIYEYNGINFPDAKIKFIENKAVVTGYLTNEPGETELKTGDVIESINGKPVEQIITEKLPYTSGSNYPTQLREMANEILRTNDSVMTIDYSRGDLRQTSKINCNLKEAGLLYQSYSRTDTCFKFMSSDIAYLYPATFKDEYLPQILDKVRNTKGLVIDLRCYPSSFDENTMLNFLFPEPVSVAKFSFCSITSPGLFTLGGDYIRGTSNSNYYKGKVVILVNEITQSSAEGLASDYRHAPNAVIIGSTTAGANGNVSFFNLPGGLHTLITGIGVYRPDGSPTQRIGIVPDIEVKPTIKGIAEGRDELLEKAVEIINGK